MLKWAKGEVLHGKESMPEIQLLLPIRCRDLNTCDISPNDTDESILKKLFPTVFRTLSLNDLADYNVMLVIDGLDELISVDQIDDPNNVLDNDQQKKKHFTL